MRTNKIQTKTNFNGYYILSNTPANRKIINEYILPKTKLIDFPISVSSGKTPLASGIMNFFQGVANENNASLRWLVQHAKNYGLELPFDDFSTLTIVSGDNAVVKMTKFEAKLLSGSAIDVLKSMLKTLFGMKSKAHIKGEPYYMESLREMTEMYYKTENKFNKFLEKNKAVKLKNCRELLLSLANEIETVGKSKSKNRT